MLTSRIFEKFDSSSAYFGAFTDRGQLAGDVVRSSDQLTLDSLNCQLVCNWEKDGNGVFSRKDSFRNCSDAPVTVYSLKSRFLFDGGDYEVYTQFHNWLTENRSGWQELVTGVTCGCASVRTAQDATPFMVLWNKQQNRGVVFHLLPNCSWEIKATRLGYGGGNMSTVLVELGLRDQNLAMEVTPGEEIAMPEILCWETSNRLDFDCHKLHSWFHKRYPRRPLAFVYNTWLYNFTDFSLESLCRQADLAAEMGLEYFVVDAGWFEYGAGWYTHVGDWKESNTAGLKGQMKQLSDHVRSVGLKFGLWMEPERAGCESEIIKSHPEQFIPYGRNHFLDFSDPEACDRIFDVTCKLVDHYGIKFFKFDFNADLYCDPTHSGFLRWHEGHARYLQRLREKYPDLYLGGCAGGGQRTQLQNYRLYDSFLASDDAGIYAQMDIFKHAVLCMPPQGLEKFTVIHSLDKYADRYEVFNREYGSNERIISCCGPAWCDLTDVRQSVLQAFHMVSPINFSCDLSALSPTLRQWLKEQIAAAKQDGEFRRAAVVRKLTDSPTVTAYQYSDAALSRVIVQAITKQSCQPTLRVYPVLNPEKMYCVNGGAAICGKELMEEGICLDTEIWNNMTQVELTQV